MQTTYCNTTTDLARAYGKVFEYLKGQQRILRNFDPYTTANVFMKPGTGYVEAMFEDGVKMTEAASIGAVDAAQEWYYDATNDVLYFYPTGGVPENHQYTIGQDIDTIKTDAVKVASREAEARLHAKHIVPIPMSPSATVSGGVVKDPYDRDFIDAVAKIACGHLAGNIDPPMFSPDGTPENVSAQLLSAGRFILDEYVSGKRTFSWELTQSEIGKAKHWPDSSNTSHGMIQLRGEYQPNRSTVTTVFSDLTAPTAFDQDVFWKVKITTGGALGTATFQVSKDNGTTYNGTDITTSNQWIEISNNIYIRFLARANAATDFIVNDTWQIEINSPGRQPLSTHVKSVPVVI